MRNRRIAIATAIGGAIAGLVAIGVAAPAQAQLTTFCSGTAADATVPGDLVVAAGNSCELTNVTVNGTTTVRADANLFLNDSALDGNLVVQPNGFASLTGTTVNGNTRLNGSYGLYTADGVHTGNLNATGAGFLFSSGSRHAGSVVSADGETVLESVRVTRQVSTTGDRLSDVYDSVIEGSFSVAGAESGSVLCLSEIDGNASVTGSSELLQIGADNPYAGCGLNVFGGNLTVQDNSTQAFISDNVIRGDLACAGNDPAPVGANNRVRGQASGQCADLSPSAASTKSAAPAGARTADILARIDARTNTGEVAAARAGHAFR